MSLLAKVPRRHTAPAEPARGPAGVPDECPRCGVELEHALREVNLTVTLDDGAEIAVVGHECAACGWCCAPSL